MPSATIWIDPSDPSSKDKLLSLQPVPGYCMFVDIIGSTAMKHKGILEWVALVHNAFVNAALFLNPFPPLKGIGDGLMFYVEDVDLEESGYTPLQLFDGLWQVATERGPHFPGVKIGAARCERVYPITFLRGNRDYYGIDVDLAARLLALALEREVVIEQRFYDAIQSLYSRLGNQEQFVSVRRLSGPTKEKLKGICEEVLVYRAR